MSQLVTPKEYVLALCTATQDSDESLGVAVRIDSSISKFNIQATKVIHGILTFSPAPDSMAIEFLNELAKVSGLRYLGEQSPLCSRRILLIQNVNSGTSCNSHLSV